MVTMKTAVVTGIGKGIGRAVAQKFLSESYRVIGTVLESAPPEKIANLDAVKMDLSKPDSIKDAVQNISALAGDQKIDILINNAGTLLDENDIVLDPAKLRSTLEVNLVGTADFTEQMLGAMSEDAHIIFISSSAGSLEDMDDVEGSHFPYHYPAYKISKCALNMYMRTLSARLRKNGAGITVSSLHPGWVKTSMGGDEAPVAPEEAANDIFALALSHPQSGQFWFKGKKHPW